MIKRLVIIRKINNRQEITFNLKMIIDKQSKKSRRKKNRIIQRYLGNRRF